jgi:hypothetical protein
MDLRIVREDRRGETGVVRGLRVRMGRRLCWEVVVRRELGELIATFRRAMRNAV